eukprot:1061780-Rhodomonas_salina.1
MKKFKVASDEFCSERLASADRGGGGQAEQDALPPGQRRPVPVKPGEGGGGGGRSSGARVSRSTSCSA